MFFDRPKTGSRTLLVHIQKNHSELATIEELSELALSAGLEVVGCVAMKRRYPHPGTFIGSGKIEEIRLWLSENHAELVVFGDDLSPTQERNLEGALNVRVLGRTGLILEIFARRARTHEGKLQVELAQLHHVSSRLVRGWTHLDRQKGGSGRGQGASSGLGGAGETQLEADQRLISERIDKIQDRLDGVRRSREQNRRSRTRSEVKTISLAGYTNAGKSTLFNRLCSANVHAEDQLFATLDPTLRQLEMPIIGHAILTDTVGFIRQLPHTLVDAFRATLEEVAQADLIVHIVDAATPLPEERIDEVDAVLEEIGASDVPRLMVYNKADLIGEPARVQRNVAGVPVSVWLSSLTGDGCDLLVEAIAERLASNVIETSVQIRPEQGKLRARFFELGAVLNEHTGEDGSITMNLRIQESSLSRIMAG